MRELMSFYGILFYMELTVKGEYANYWGRQAEDSIFGACGVDLENVMALKRFKHLRQALSFRSEVSVETLQPDPAARIRCLLNLLKVTGGKYIDLGRDVALDEASESVRRDYHHGVSVEHQMIASSWCDGNIVRVVSNADASILSTVQRRVGADTIQCVAPLCVENYNAYMQGVARLDQTRARFSIADGHSFQKWHKTLAMALTDITRCNTKLVLPTETCRDPYRDFVLDLINDLLSVKWAEAPSSAQMLYTTNVLDSSALATPSPAQVDGQDSAVDGRRSTFEVRGSGIDLRDSRSSDSAGDEQASVELQGNHPSSRAYTRSQHHKKRKGDGALSTDECTKVSLK
ncbi:unnamed protein product [Phytophthora fragariaefolia]|uniref:Unnamed protein product n=1 Tax=Phytophthora fragariaefolia TaxID=1490495 RepID=A0A9W6Y815_9STRA|nr:unnamed protein product [Phytophthora fragariaefolia]